MTQLFREQHMEIGMQFFEKNVVVFVKIFFLQTIQLLNPIDNLPSTSSSQSENENDEVVSPVPLTEISCM